MGKIFDNLPPGIWYEADRRRYRVRIYSGTTPIHLSYHISLEEAIVAWREAQIKRHSLLIYPSTQLTSERDQLMALLGHEPSENTGGIPLNQLFTVKQFIEAYFEKGRRPSKYTVWHWIRQKRLPAQRIGRSYYIYPEDAQKFLDSERKTP